MTKSNKNLAPVKRDESFTENLPAVASEVAPGVGLLGLTDISTAKVGDGFVADIYLSIPEGKQFGPVVFLGDGGMKEMEDPGKPGEMRPVQTWLFEIPGQKDKRLRVCGFTALDTELKQCGSGETLVIQRFPRTLSKKQRMFTPVIVYKQQ